MNKLINLCAVFFSTALLFSCKQDAKVPQLGKHTAKTVVAAMTLQEKAKMVVGMSFHLPDKHVAEIPECNRKITMS